METKYDYIINLLLNNWVIVIVVIVVIILSAIPKAKDGIKTIISLFNRKNDFVSEYADEKITFDVKLRSKDFDVVKINATTHSLGVHAEREWLKKFYPGYDENMQSLRHITTKDGRELTFDVLSIQKGNKQKRIYFDITDFFKGSVIPYFGGLHQYAEQKINDIYSEKI